MFSSGYHTRICMILICLINVNVNFNHFVQEVSARYSTVKLLFSPLELKCLIRRYFETVNILLLLRLSPF